MRGCIIEADKSDYQNDLLSKPDIKRINLNLDNVKFDINHSKEPIEGCKLVENSIVDDSIIIANTKVNAGSWIVTIQVDNPELENLILNGEVAGFSLFSYSNEAETYEEVQNKEDVYPIFISFVPNPSNQLRFEVLSEMKYISKSENDIMANEDKTFIEKLKELISSFEKGEEVPADPKEPAAKEEENKEPAEPADPKKEDEVKKACGDETKDEVKKEGEAPAGVKVETQQTTDIDAKLDKIIEILGAVVKPEEPEEPKEPEEPTENKNNYIVKSETVKNDKVTVPREAKKPCFDLFGRKL